MINKITKSEYLNIWQDIIEDAFECSSAEYRKGSTFYKKHIYKIDEDYFPSYPELWGYWESNVFLYDDYYGYERLDITELTRVEKVKKIIETFEWIPIKAQ